MTPEKNANAGAATPAARRRFNVLNRSYSHPSRTATFRGFHCSFCERAYPWRDHGGGSRTARFCHTCAWILELTRRGDRLAAFDAACGGFKL